MPREISYNAGMGLVNQFLADNFPSYSGYSSQTNQYLVRNVANVPESPASISLWMGGVLTAGYSVFLNLDATSVVTLSVNLVSGSNTKIAADGNLYLKSVTNGLWYPLIATGNDSAASLQVGQLGVNLDSQPSLAMPFAELGPGELSMIKLPSSITITASKIPDGNGPCKILYAVYSR